MPHRADPPPPSYAARAAGHGHPPALSPMMRGAGGGAPMMMSHAEHLWAARNGGYPTNAVGSPMRRIMMAEALQQQQQQQQQLLQAQQQAAVPYRRSNNMATTPKRSHEAPKYEDPEQTAATALLLAGRVQHNKEDAASSSSQVSREEKPQQPPPKKRKKHRDFMRKHAPSSGDDDAAAAEDASNNSNNNNNQPCHVSPVSSSSVSDGGSTTTANKNHHPTTHSPPQAQRPTTVLVPHFPSVLHHVLTYSDGAVLRWLPHGQAWKVLRWDALQRTILPKHFPQLSDDDGKASGSVDSFLWHVRAWGFTEITDGPDVGAYQHVLFMKGMPKLCLQMHLKPEKTPSLEESASPERKNSMSSTASLSTASTVSHKNLVEPRHLQVPSLRDSIEAWVPHRRFSTGTIMTNVPVGGGPLRGALRSGRGGARPAHHVAIAHQRSDESSDSTGSFPVSQRGKALRARVVRSAVPKELAASGFGPHLQQQQQQQQPVAVAVSKKTKRQLPLAHHNAAAAFRHARA